MGTRITTKGQVTIPVEIRAAARIEAGAELEWVYDAATRRVIATKAGDGTRLGKSRFARARGSASTDMTTDQIMALTRDPNRP